MRRHVVLTLFLIMAAIAAGFAMVPGERERWTMLERDNRNEEALAILDARYRAGQRDADTLLHLYKLLMSFANVARASDVIEQFVAARPDDVQAVTLLAKHCADTANVIGEEKALKRLFELSPSQETAQKLLSLYRLQGAFDQEESFLRLLLAKKLITASDAERFGLLLIAGGDFAGARQALNYFDDIAGPEKLIGRIALFDLLTQHGDTQTALAKAARWIPNWRRAALASPTGLDVSPVRLVQRMIATSAPAARQILCATQSGSNNSTDVRLQDLACPDPPMCRQQNFKGITLGIATKLPLTPLARSDERTGNAAHQDGVAKRTQFGVAIKPADCC